MGDWGLRPFYPFGFMLFVIFMLVKKGAARPLDSLISDYKVDVTPRPFLCLHKEKGKEMHSLMRREWLCETRKRVSRGVYGCGMLV